jgi:hypothetical protein
VQLIAEKFILSLDDDDEIDQTTNQPKQAMSSG